MAHDFISGRRAQACGLAGFCGVDHRPPTDGIQPNIVQQISDVICHLRDSRDMTIVNRC